MSSAELRELTSARNVNCEDLHFYGLFYWASAKKKKKRKKTPHTLWCGCNPIFRPSCKPVSLSFSSVWLHQLIKTLNFHNKHNKAFFVCVLLFFFFLFLLCVKKKKKTHSGLLEPPTSSPAPLVQSSLIKACAFPCYRQVHLQTTIRQTSALPLCRRAINPANVICGCNPLEKLNWSVSTASGVLPAFAPAMNRAPQASGLYGWRRTLCWRRFWCHYHVFPIKPQP